MRCSVYCIYNQTELLFYLPLPRPASPPRFFKEIYKKASSSLQLQKAKMSDSSAPTDNPVYKLYRYTPNIVAAVIFLVVFAATTLYHIYQMIRARSWYFTPLVIGGICMFVFYFLHLISISFQPPAPSIQDHNLIQCANSRSCRIHLPNYGAFQHRVHSHLQHHHDSDLTRTGTLRRFDIHGSRTTDRRTRRRRPVTHPQEVDDQDFRHWRCHCIFESSSRYVALRSLVPLHPNVESEEYVLI